MMVYNQYFHFLDKEVLIVYLQQLSNYLPTYNLGEKRTIKHFLFPPVKVFISFTEL